MEKRDCLFLCPGPRGLAGYIGHIQMTHLQLLAHLAGWRSNPTFDCLETLQPRLFCQRYTTAAFCPFPHWQNTYWQLDTISQWNQAQAELEEIE
jgi:hypothetical protein